MARENGAPFGQLLQNGFSMICIVGRDGPDLCAAIHRDKRQPRGLGAVLHVEVGYAAFPPGLLVAANQLESGSSTV